MFNLFNEEVSLISCIIGCILLTIFLLIEEKKQIVITCDTYPKEIIDMDERLRTRFSWGLTVAIEPPELKKQKSLKLV